MQKTLIFLALLALLCVTQTSGVDVKGFIDAGSSGSKAFRVVGTAAAESTKFSPPASTLLNHATAYTVKPGDVAIGSGTKTFRKDYIKAVLKGRFLDDDTGEVPLQATAGMRIVTRATNDLIYKGKDDTPGICDTKRAGDKVAVPEAGEKCGTIAGTVEAFYEWLAVLKTYKAGTDFKFGIISSGGASAQLAWPMTKEETKKFKEFRKTLDDDSTLPSYAMTNDFPPMFNAINEHSHRYLKNRNWINDFVSYVPYRELPVVHREGFKKDFYALAVVSFLSIGPASRGLGSSPLPDNMFLAGGVVEVTNHLQANDFCQISNVAYDYAKCRHALAVLFKKDLLYSKVAAWFTANHDASIPFYANTAAAGFTHSLKDDLRPAGAKVIAGVINPTHHDVISEEIKAKFEAVVDPINPEACKTAVGTGDAKKCYDALSKWLAMRCTDAALKKIKFNKPTGVPALLSDCGSAFFIDTYYFSFFSTHTVEWPTTGAETNEFLASGAVSGSPLAVKNDYDKTAAPSEAGLTDPTFFQTVDWTIGAMYYYENPGAPFTHLLRVKKGPKDPAPDKHMEGDSGTKATTTKFIEESGRFRLRNILVNNKA